MLKLLSIFNVFIMYVHITNLKWFITDSFCYLASREKRGRGRSWPVTMKTDLLCGITPEACSGVMVRKSSNLKCIFGCIGAYSIAEDLPMKIMESNTGHWTNTWTLIWISLTIFSAVQVIRETKATLFSNVFQQKFFITSSMVS